MSELQERIKALEDPMICKMYYVVLSTPLQPMSELLPVLPDHLNYMIEQEQRGVVFASGPFLSGEEVIPGSGMTIIRVSSLEEARVFAQADPFVVRGLRSSVIKRWQINEGSYTVTVNYSDRSYHID